jgi:hypothetical protein
MQFGFEQCPYCGNVSGFIYIHGHYQCKRCHQNVMPCCGGEQQTQTNEVTPNNKPISNANHSKPD